MEKFSYLKTEEIVQNGVVLNHHTEKLKERQKLILKQKRECVRIRINNGVPLRRRTIRERENRKLSIFPAPHY
ncbi:unnamed protein product [Citrullus colocynthis]|uniref:Uncharacterized protein n=1 Tax=Citrullus colocynthis TaxID=252529 RepID=A0ABP0YC71_9ROSI